MRVISVAALREFWAKYPDAEQPLKAWFEEVKAASWSNPAEMKSMFKSASVLRNGRAVFNIAGNKYRLIVAISYKIQIVYIKFVGTHGQYDKIDAQVVEWDK